MKTRHASLTGIYLGILITAMTIGAHAEGSTFFSPTDDAYLDNGVRYNNNDLRVENNRRVIYLKYDIAGLQGRVTYVGLQMKQSIDPGSGTIRVYKGTSTNWTENNLLSTNKPGKGAQVGILSGSFSGGAWYTWDVTPLLTGNEVVSVILEMDAGGNDVAFAAKESGNTPELLVLVDTWTTQPPVADAGLDQNVKDSDGNGTESVTLHGSGSYDPDGGSIISYLWRENGSVIATTASPQVTLAVGTHTLELKVTDEESDVDFDTVIVTVTPNLIQNGDFSNGTSNWGTWAYNTGGSSLSTVNEQGFLTITDGGSSQWKTTLYQDNLEIQNGVTYTVGAELKSTGGPKNITIQVRELGGDWSAYGSQSFSINTSAMLLCQFEFTMTAATDNNAQFVIMCGGDNNDMIIDNVVVTDGSGGNMAPVAHAGNDINAKTGHTVTLDGSNSTDPDGGPSLLSYSWTQTSGPQVELVGAGSVMAAFCPQETGTYEFEIKVSDGSDIGTDRILITVHPRSLSSNANAGPDVKAMTGTAVHLVNHKEYEEGTGGITHSWNQLSGQTVQISGGNTEDAVFNPPAAGTYTFELTATDASGTDKDTVSVTVIEKGEDIEWPNHFSGANSDPWLALHHQGITVMRPRILALNFVNASSMQEMHNLLSNMINVVAEASRYHGYNDPGAPAFIEYELAYEIDLRDEQVPPDYPYLNSTRYPREIPVEGAWGFDYEQLFSNEFTQYYGIDDPDNPGTMLSLEAAIEKGLVHEIWVYGDADSPDVNAAEILELKPCYDENRIRRFSMPMERHAGNGAFDTEDVIPGNRTVRIGWFNKKRGPGCYLESLSHGFEQTGNRSVIPYLYKYFPYFGNFRLNELYGAPHHDWYSTPYEEGNYLDYPTTSSVHYNYPKDGNWFEGTIQNYDAVCGNVHFPPNARRHYDLASPYTVETSCMHFLDGTGMTKYFSTLDFSQYNDFAHDCDGPFLVWWRQNFPGLNNLSIDGEGNQMLNWFTFIYY